MLWNVTMDHLGTVNKMTRPLSFYVPAANAANPQLVKSRIWISKVMLKCGREQSSYGEQQFLRSTPERKSLRRLLKTQGTAKRWEMDGNTGMILLESWSSCWKGRSKRLDLKEILSARLALLGSFMGTVRVQNTEKKVGRLWWQSTLQSCRTD